MQNDDNYSKVERKQRQAEYLKDAMQAVKRQNPALLEGCKQFIVGSKLDATYNQYLIMRESLRLVTAYENADTNLDKFVYEINKI